MRSDGARPPAAVRRGRGRRRRRAGRGVRLTLRHGLLVAVVVSALVVSVLAVVAVRHDPKPLLASGTGDFNSVGADYLRGSGGGGGGAGGGIWLAAPQLTLASATVLDISGGAGGSGTNDRDGGHGSPGYIRLDTDTHTLPNEPPGTNRDGPR